MRAIKLTVFMGLIFLIGFNSCRNSENKQLGDPAMIIEAGYLCGWGGGTDSLVITKDEIRYLFFIPRLSAKPQIQKKRSVSPQEWTQIIDSFNPDEFSKLAYNSCNVCFDGCDEWISVHHNLNTHKITFTKGLKIENISQLQLKLSALRAEFNP